jgi:hypothetical protein
MYVTAGKSLSTLFALLTTVELLSSLAATSWNAESGTQIKNREDNSTNNNEVILTVDPTTNPLGKQHFVFPDHILTFLNATMTAKCMPMMVPMDASHYFNVGNEECATAVIAALEAKFTGYHFIVGVYNGHIKKECQTSCHLNRFNF